MPSKLPFVRLAQPNEGPLLHHLALASGKWEIEGLDWNFDPFPYWLVAELDGEAVGCVQMCPSRPFAFLEFLSLLPGLSQRDKGIVVRDMCNAARQRCKSMGAQFVSLTVQPDLDNWVRVLERRGAFKWYDGGTAMLMRSDDV